MHTHKDVVAEYYAAFNRRDDDVYARLFTSDCRVVAPGVEASGLEAMQAFDRVWTSAFAEARVESLRMTEVDGVVVTSNWFHGGTQVQPLATSAGTIPVLGRAFSAPYAATFEFEGGRIKTQRLVFDAAFVPRALGVPAGAAAPSNADVVAGIYDAFARGDIGAVLDRIDPQAELVFEGPAEVTWAGTFHGHEGWMRFFQTLGQQVDDIRVTMEPFASHGDRVAASGRYRGRVRHTGRTIDSPLVHLWTLRDGLVVQCVELTNTAAEAAACTTRATVLA